MEAKSYYILIFSHPAWRCLWASLMVMRTVYYKVGNLPAVDGRYGEGDKI